MDSLNEFWIRILIILQHHYTELFSFLISALVNLFLWMKYLLSLLLLVFLAVNVANAQFFQTGQDPSRIQWRQVNTDNFQVVYPQEFEKEAQRLLYVLTKAYEHGSQSMNFNPRKISVVLHTLTANSNGLVAWAPKRMELYTTPNQTIYSQDWLEQLAIHEFRHLMQLDKIESEMPFLLKLIFGEQATAMVTGLYLPLWFLEGDAVVAETAMSQSGRGRMASFSMEYRAQLAEKGKYSYDKAYLGSYKDFIPDHYKLGYWMVGMSQEKYGADLWKDVLNHVAKRPLSITPVNSVLKRQTGLNTRQLYDQVFNELIESWKLKAATSENGHSVVSPNTKSYTNYLYPGFYQDSLIIAYRTSLNDIARFVMIDPNKREKVLYTPGSVYDESISVRGHLIVWAERRADIRWTHADKTIICVYDIQTGKKRELHPENKLFSPAISPDLKSLAGVETDNENNFFLSVYDLESGALRQRFKTPDNQYFFTPAWGEKGEKLYIVCLSSKGKYLASYDLQTKHFQKLTPFTYGNIKNPIYINNRILFSADFLGKDRLYTIEIATGKIYPLYDPAFGADYPSAVNSRNQFLFSNYTSRGYQLALTDLKEKDRMAEVTDISLQSDKLSESLASREGGIPEFQKPDSIAYPTRPYSKAGNLFNFHSWAPAYIDIDNYAIRPGVSLFSQNLLGTAEMRLGYNYDVTNKTGKYKADFNYYGWFPEFNGSLTYGKGTTNYYRITNYSNPHIPADTVAMRSRWNEFTAELGGRLPFNFSRGKYSTGLFPGLNYSFSSINRTDQQVDSNLYAGNYHALSYRLNYYHLLRQSQQNLMPRWGHQVDMVYKHTPFEGNDLGSLIGIQSVLYFPGLGKNHGIRIYQGYQEKTFVHSFGFSNFIRSPRGIQWYQNNRMYSLVTDYRMPLAYPDLSIGKLVYLKRIKTSLFYDYAWYSVPVTDRNHITIPNQHQFMANSLGMDLTSDLHVLRFFAPMEVGIRSVYLPQTGSFAFNLLFAVDFNGF